MRSFPFLLLLCLTTLAVADNKICLPTLVKNENGNPLGKPETLNNNPSVPLSIWSDKKDMPLSIKNERTGKIHSFNSIMNNADITSVSLDGKSALISTFDGKENKTISYILSDLDKETPTQKKLSKSLNNGSNNDFLSPNGKYLVRPRYVYENNQSYNMYDFENLETGETQSHRAQGYDRFNTFIDGTDDKIVIQSDAGASIIDLNTKKSSFYPNSIGVGSNTRYYAPKNEIISIEPYSRQISISEYIPDLLYHDSVRTVEFPNGINSSIMEFLVTRDGKKIVLRTQDEIVIFHKDTLLEMSRITLPKNVSNLTVSPTGKYMTIQTWGDSQGQNHTIPIKLNDDGKMEFGPRLLNSWAASTEDGILVNGTETYIWKVECPHSVVSPDSPLCPTKPERVLPLGQETEDWFKEATLSNQCQADFDQAFWDSVTRIPNEKEAVSEEVLKLFLMRFQKPNGFDLEKHRKLALTILTSDLVTKEPELIAGFLENLFAKDGQFYATLLNYFPTLKSVPPATKASPCRSKSENDLVTNKILEQFRADASGNASVFESIDKYFPIRRPIVNLPKNEKTKLHEALTESIRTRAQGSNEFSHVFTSKLYYLVHDALAPLFGAPQSNLTDLTFVRENDSIVPVLLGGHPIGNSQRTPYGFHSRRVGQVRFKENGKPIEHDVTAKVRWHQDGKQFDGVFDLKYFSTGEYIPKEKAPRYDEMWKNKNLTGAIIVGSNLKGSASSLLDEYLNYYQGSGFEFDSKRNQIADMKEYMKEKITGGEMDYFVKEAHSDGDTMNLFRLDKKSEYLKGTKKNRDGTSETIYLIYPTSDYGDNVLLPNYEFGEWIRKRKENGHGQIAYFNTSCSSYSKVVREVEATRDSTLLNIATKNSALTFSNYETSALRLVLEGFRNRKDYDGIRTDLKRNQGYSSGMKDGYLFPDEKGYEEAIINQMLPYEVRTSVFTDGKPYHFDEHIAH